MSRRGHYWSVGVFRDLDEMRAWVRGLHPRTRKRPVACCVHRNRKPGDLHLGYVCFALPHVGSGTVAHEMVHAAVHTLSPGGKATVNEERLAMMVDHMTSTFWKRWYRYHAGTADA